MRKLASIVDEIESGLQPSVALDKAVLWVDGENVIFDRGGVGPMLGHYVLFAKPASLPILGLQEALVGGNKYIFFGDKENLYYWKEGDAAATDVTHGAGDYTGGDLDKWSFCPWGEHMVACNGDNEVPQYWDSSAPSAFVDFNTGTDYPSSGRAEVAAKVGPFLFFLNTDQEVYVLQWCDEDDRAVWTPTTGNLAGDLALRDLNSPIRCAVRLGPGLGVYGDDKLHAVNLVGSPLVFGQEQRLDGIGAFGKHSVSVLDRLNFGMGPRGIFMTDGVSFEYIDHPAIHDLIYEDINLEATQLVTSWVDPAQWTVFFSYPQGGHDTNSRSVGYNYKNRTWGIFKMARTAASSEGIFNGALAGDVDGNVYLQGLRGTVPSPEAEPLTLDEPTAEASMGYGKGGYGDLGYGGYWSGDG
jgi:hypothetical protein